MSFAAGRLVFMVISQNVGDCRGSGSTGSTGSHPGLQNIEAAELQLKKTRPRLSAENSVVWQAVCVFSYHDSHNVCFIEAVKMILEPVSD